MNLFSKWFGVRETSRREETLNPDVHARPSDPWFWDHFDGAAKIVLSLVPPECLLKGRKVVDFGCGDGATTLGVASNIQADVVGVDLYQTFRDLPNLSQRNLGVPDLPANISFEQVQAGKPLPFLDDSMDLAYSWSVFEHVSDIRQVLAELRRVTKPGGFLFIQIEPLFHGPFGSHLQRLVNLPWAHLLYGEEEYLRLVESAPDEVPEHAQDSLYRNHAFEDLKRYLIGEYRSLNRITAPELIELVSEGGFDIRSTKLIMEEKLAPDQRLLEKYPLDLLLTNQIVLLAQKGRC
jgi:ubiquinone/menaquinone biosynthesis C-methylase UbiE